MVEGPMIELAEESHEIVGDESAWRMLPQDLDLHPVIGRNLLRGETPEIEARCRIGLGDGEIGEGDLVETPHLLRPEDIAPGVVQRIGRLITCGAASCWNAARSSAPQDRTVLWQPYSLSVCQPATASLPP